MPAAINLESWTWQTKEQNSFRVMCMLMFICTSMSVLVLLLVCMFMLRFMFLITCMCMCLCMCIRLLTRMCMIMFMCMLISMFMLMSLIYSCFKVDEKENMDDIKLLSEEDMESMETSLDDLNEVLNSKPFQSSLSMNLPIF